MAELGIDQNYLIAQLVNFAIFFAIFKFFIAKPLMTYVRKQRTQDEQRERIARDLQKREEEWEMEYKERKHKAQQEVEAVLKQAKEDGEKVKNTIIEDAQKEGEVLVAKAKKEMERERIALHEEMRKHAADIAVVLVEQAFAQYLSADAKKEITKRMAQEATKRDTSILN